MLPTDVPGPRANVLGVGINAIDMAQALRRCDRLLQTGSKGYVCLTGVHGVMEAQRDGALREVLNRSYLCLPDGMPTVWVGRLQGLSGISRIYGPDFMLAMCRYGLERGYRHFLYGGNCGVAQKLKRQLELRLPGIEIVGTYTPPFRALTPSEEHQVLALVNRARPDIVWVGLSTPKQERFMAQYLGVLDTKLMAGVGAAFDIHAGLMQDAPLWMKNSGLQWLDRLRREPHRLWRRYLTNNPQFVWRIGLQLSGVKKFDPG